MTDLDQLAHRAVATVNLLAARGAALATGVAGFVGLVAIAVYLLGSAALEGSVRTGWLLVGGALVIIAVGAPLLARWRLGAVRRHATELVGEVRTVLQRGGDAQRVVVDTFERTDPTAASGGIRQQAIVVQSRQFQDLRDLTSSVGDVRRLTAAMRAMTSFPLLLLTALVLMLVFFVLGFLFLIAWIL